MPPLRAAWLAKAVAFALVLAMAAFARAYHWDDVFTDHGVVFAYDSDPNYHVLQAERLLHGTGPIWFDQRLDWPLGAVVVWPPLFDATIAGLTRLAYGPAAGRAELERVASILPIALGLLTIALVVALGHVLLGRRRGLGAGFILSLLMGHVMVSSVGAADQHVSEALLATVF